MKHDKKAERALIGSVLRGDAESLEKIFGVVKVDDFWGESHRCIWRGMVRCWEQFQCVDLVPLTKDIHDAGDLKTIGGMAVLAPMAAECVPRNWKIYHESMRGTGRVRELLAIAEAVKTVEAGGDPFEIASEAVEGLLRISGEAPAQTLPTFRDVGGRFLRWMVRNSEEYERVGRSPQMSFGWEKIDKAIPVYPGKSTILAGGSGSGKSGLALQGLITSAIEHGEGGLFISLEMGAELAYMRAISRRIDISESKILRGDVEKFDTNRIEVLIQEAGGLPLVIDDQCPADVVSVERRIRAAAKEGIKWVVVDYLQLMTYPGRKFDRLSLELGAITYRLHRTAQRFGIGLLILAQLKKSGEFQTAKTKDDIKDGGDSVQAVDAAVLMWRPNDLPQEEREKRSKADGVSVEDDTMRIETSKHRYGQPAGGTFGWSRGRVVPLGETWDRNGKEPSRWVRELLGRNVYRPS